MTAEEFLEYVSQLTGTEVKGADQIDHDGLSKILADGNRSIDWSQFNELLLMVHKNRVELPFFAHFFSPNPTIDGIVEGVRRFQQSAMLLYGNFVFAYRELSRIKAPEAFEEAVAGATEQGNAELHFKERERRLLEIERIGKEQTPYVGYLSAGEVVADYRRCELLLRAISGALSAATWESYLAQVRAMADSKEAGTLEGMIANFRGMNSGAGVSRFASYLEDSDQRLKELKEDVSSLRRKAARNQNTYLTWDHMDVYFATSMRKAWEYKDLYEFIERLMASSELQELDLRYFDPTQAYTDNRVNKGLVEALMLKRARCTVYSVQDTDTLGKDSELASTLAQGKPVIAFVPEIEPGVRAKQLQAEAPGTILERFRFVLYADEQLGQRLDGQQSKAVERIQDQLDAFCAQRIWSSISDDKEVKRFRETAGTDLELFCQVIAESEKAVYDRRARTLRESHPLAIQVNLDTGVANGVLVVRRISDCAALLRRVLLRKMEFSVEEDHGMWYLRENISGCVYRVVTNDRKLNNCFWNFYLR